MAASCPESRVLIIMTGGTICMKPSEDGLVPARNFLSDGMQPRPSFNDGSSPGGIEVVVDDAGTVKSLQSLRTPVSKYKRSTRYCVLEFENLLDSSSIDSDGWSAIAKVVYRNYTLFDGFVVLHGTDSLAYTCSALSFMLQDLGKPVILTGSQAPIFQLQNDAVDNLLGSMIIAGHFTIPECCLFFGWKLFRGNRATKVSATDFAAFDSPNFPPLATMNAMGTDVLWHLVYRPTQLRRLSLQLDLDTAHVACLKIFPGLKPEMVDAVLRVSGLRGLVIESFGAGNTPGGAGSPMTKVLSDAVKRGIVIVNVSQCLSGNVSNLYAPATALNREGIVLGHDMTSEAALTKLAYLLALPSAKPERVAEQMVLSLRGELTESSKTDFQHPISEQMSPRVATMASLCYAIGEGNTETFSNTLQSSKRYLFNDTDYLGNTPLHIAAAGENVEILQTMLSNGASVHVRNAMNQTPLDVAKLSGRASHADVLIQAGAHERPH